MLKTWNLRNKLQNCIQFQYFYCILIISSFIPGTPRRKKKIVHQTTATDDKKLQSTLKKLAVNPISGIEEVNIFKNDGTVNIFNNPRTQASLASNTFAVTGHSETRNVSCTISREFHTLVSFDESCLVFVVILAQRFHQWTGRNEPPPAHGIHQQSH